MNYNAPLTPWMTLIACFFASAISAQQPERQQLLRFELCEEPGQCYEVLYEPCDSIAGYPCEMLYFRHWGVENDTCHSLLIAKLKPKQLMDCVVGHNHVEKHKDKNDDDCCLEKTIPYERIYLDMNDGCSAPDLRNFRPNKGEYYGVQIQGINLNLYKVSVNGQDTTTAQAVKFPTFGDFPLEAINALVGGVGSLTSNVETVSHELGTPKFDLMIGFMRAEECQQCVDSIDAVLQQMTMASIQADLTNFVKETLNGYSDSIDHHASATLVAKSEIDSVMMEAQLHALDLEATGRTSNATMDQRAVLEAIMRLREQLRHSQKRANSLREEHSKFIAKEDIAAIIKGDEKIKKLSDKVSGGLSKLSIATGEALGSIDATKSSALLRRLQDLEANADHIYNSAPFLYKGGAANIDINITPRDPVSNLQSYSASLGFPLYSKTYVGVSAAFYGSGLFNEAFSTIDSTIITATDTTQRKFLKQEKGPKNEIGSALLFTYGTKFKAAGVKDGSTIGVHVSIGPGISLTNVVRPRLLVGGGVSFGREHMFMVNGGVITGFVDRRSAAFEKDGPFKW